MPNSNLENKKNSVIIVNFRSDQYLEKCIASLYNFEKTENFEIILVNNEWGKELGVITRKFPAITLINNEKNLGFGQAVNLGAKKAQGEILFFLNPDTEIQAPFWEQIKRLFREDPKLAIMGPKIIDSEGKKQAWIFGKKLNFWQLLKNNLLEEKEKKEELAKEVDWVSGAGMFVRREDFEGAGGFDEKFFMYFEDMDLCLRLGNLGKKIMYFPKLQIKHWENGSTMEEKERKESYYASQDYYFQKHLGKFQAGLVRSLRKIIK